MTVKKSNQQRRKYPEVISWLAKNEIEENTEHNIYREHHQWTSEPELWMYQPGCEPKKALNHKLTLKKYNSIGRKNSIDSDDISESSENSNNNNRQILNFNTQNKNLHNSITNTTVYNRKSQRRHRMKYGKKLQSSKSDSYHKKYVWDMVFNERAVLAIKEEYRQMHKRKLKIKNSNNCRKPSGTASECSQSSITKHNQKMNDILSRSISQRPMITRHMSHKEEIRKISQTGSAIFAHIDKNQQIDKSIAGIHAGRHPAKSSSKDSKATNENNNTSNIQQNISTNALSLKNNNTSVGGTNSYFNNNSSGQMTSGSPSYPGYPQVPYPTLDPMLLSALMVGPIGNLFQINPILNYQISNNQNISNHYQYNTQVQSPSPYNLSSSSSGYPNTQHYFQRDLINQIQNKNIKDSVPQTPAVAQKRFEQEDQPSSEESEDIRPSRHAINDDSNDLHIKSGKKIQRTKTYFTQPKSEKFTNISTNSFSNTKEKDMKNTKTLSSALPLPVNLSSNTNSKDGNKTVLEYLSKLKCSVETLKQSGWYWNKVNGETAMEIVERKGLGGFLIRDSTHQKYLFTLTVHTTNGPTNVRIIFKQGLFGLDCDQSNQSGVKFNCVVDMIAHYVNNSKKYKRIQNRKQKMIQQESNQIKKVEEDQDSIALLLLAPCRKQPPTLQHLARIAINKKLSRRTAKLNGLKLEDIVKNNDLINYCKKYPYSV